MSKQGSKVQREVTILTRYFFKKGPQAGRVCCRVRNDQGIIHTVVIEPDGRTSCSCMSFKSCYHILAVQTAESARAAAQQSAQPARPSSVSLANSPKSRTNGVTAQVRSVKTRQQGVIKALPAATPLARDEMPVDPMMLASIRSNRGFSFWR